MVTELNTEFQTGKIKIHVIYFCVGTVYKTILNNYIKNKILKAEDITQLQYRNPKNLKHLLSDIYFGSKCASKAVNNNYSREELQKFKTSCLYFYIEMAHQIYKRIPFKDPMMQALKHIRFFRAK